MAKDGYTTITRHRRQTQQSTNRSRRLYAMIIRLCVREGTVEDAKMPSNDKGPTRQQP